MLRLRVNASDAVRMDVCRGVGRDHFYDRVPPSSGILVKVFYVLTCLNYSSYSMRFSKQAITQVNATFSAMLTALSIRSNAT